MKTNKNPDDLVVTTHVKYKGKDRAYEFYLPEALIKEMLFLGVSDIEDVKDLNSFDRFIEMRRTLTPHMNIVNIKLNKLSEHIFRLINKILIKETK